MHSQTTTDHEVTPSAEPTDTPVVAETSGFAELRLHDALLKALATGGYSKPTPVQQTAIPAALAGHDLMVSAQTGSGKTAAFMLPCLHRLTMPPAVRSAGPRVLVLTPTRELALQVTRAAETYGKYLRQIKVVSILGGMPYPLQNKLLSRPVDILVATPGRLLDHIQRGRIDFSRLETLILDEADRMLDMGFIEDVEAIGKAIAQARTTRWQTLMFSATFDGPIARLAQTLLHEPQRIEIAGAQTRHENIEQRLFYANDASHKGRLLEHLLRDGEVKQAIVFSATKANTDELAAQLSRQGFSAAALHGDMNQRTRTRTLDDLRRGRISVLVATDVAARGIDVQGISHVINYDLPRTEADYVHRIGRTGRAGRAGLALSLAASRDVGLVKRIERYMAQTIPVHEVAGMEPSFRPHLRKHGARDGGFKNPAARQDRRPNHAPRPGGRPGYGTGRSEGKRI